MEQLIKLLVTNGWQVTITLSGMTAKRKLPKFGYYYTIKIPEAKYQHAIDNFKDIFK